MKQFLLLGALLISTTIPVGAAPSDSDMGFAPTDSGMQPSARDVGAAGLAVRGNGGNGQRSMSAYASSSTGDMGGTHNTPKPDEGFYWGDNANMNTWESRNGNSGKIFETVQDHGKEAEGGGNKSTSHQGRVSQMLIRHSDDPNRGFARTGLLAPSSVGNGSFAKPLWNDRGYMGPTDHAIENVVGPQAFRLKQAGLAGVNASICAPNGKD